MGSRTLTGGQWERIEPLLAASFRAFVALAHAIARLA